MSKRKRKAESGQPTVIGELLARREELLQRECALHASGTRDERRARLIKDEARFLRQKILEEVPQTRGDTGIVVLVMIDEIDGVGGTNEIDRANLELVRAALLRQVRFLINDGTIDLRDPVVREAAQDALADVVELFPELAGKPVKRKAA